MPAHDFLNTSDGELLTRADECLQRAGSALEVAPPYFDEHTRLRLFLEAQSCLTEILRRRAEQTAERDRERNEEIAERDHKLEIWVIRLISVEIFLSLLFGFLGLWEGWKQGKAVDRQVAVLAHMDTSTVATSDSLQKLVTAQDASLKILQQQQAERAKKPRLALYAGNIPLGRASVRLNPRAGGAQTVASLDLLLKNEGDAPVSTFRLHAVVPATVVVFTEQQLITVPEPEPPADPKTYRVTLQLPLLPAGETVRIHTQIFVPKGYSPFKIPFTVDALELQAVALLGSLTVLPPRP
jgi:hypothetical protein